MRRTLCMMVALAASCATPESPTMSGDETGSAGSDTGSGGSGGGSGSGSVCDAVANTGDLLRTIDLGPGGGLLGPLNNLALGTDRLLFASNANPSNPPPGTTLELSLAGDVLASFPFGRVVASDAAGNLYIAGPFTEPIDFGLGVLTPVGNIDTFVVKLDAKGNVIAQFALGECGDGVQSIAVAADGRIAVSGPAMGTVVVDAAGRLLFMSELFGDVVFDARGNLAIGGGPTITELDTAGNRVYSHTFPGGFITSVAVGPDNEIALVGDYNGMVEIFGTTYFSRSGQELRFTGVFIVRLDAAGNPTFKTGDYFAIDANGVALDSNGNLVFAGAIASAAVNRRSLVSKLDARGDELFRDEQIPLPGAGAAHAVAIDACNDIFVSIDASRSFLDLHQFVVKIAH